MTTSLAMSRRYLLAAGASSLAVACGGATPVPSSAAAPGTTHQEEMVRKWYAAWEHFTFKGDKVAALECYFGNQTGYPSAANKGNGRE
jgi:hypothetical protein